jgi:hypothetical protein
MTDGGLIFSILQCRKLIEDRAWGRPWLPQWSRFWKEGITKIGLITFKHHEGGNRFWENRALQYGMM